MQSNVTFKTQFFFFAVKCVFDLYPEDDDRSLVRYFIKMFLPGCKHVNLFLSVFAKKALNLIQLVFFIYILMSVFTVPL